MSSKLINRRIQKLNRKKTIFRRFHKFIVVEQKIVCFYHFRIGWGRHSIKIGWGRRVFRIGWGRHSIKIGWGRHVFRIGWGRTRSWTADRVLGGRPRRRGRPARWSQAPGWWFEAAARPPKVRSLSAPVWPQFFRIPKPWEWWSHSVACKDIWRRKMFSN